MKSPRDHKNYRNRGSKKLSFTYEDLAKYTGHEVSTVRGRFKWNGIQSLMSYISSPTIKSSILLTPDEVAKILSRFGPADVAMECWANRWPKLYFYWCCESDCKNILFSPGRCEKHGGGRPALFMSLTNGYGHFRIRANDKDNNFHRIIMGCPRGLTVHHIDFNVWNNRLENLQILTNKEHLRIHLQHGGMFPKGTRKPLHNAPIRDGEW